MRGTDGGEGWWTGERWGDVEGEGLGEGNPGEQISAMEMGGREWRRAVQSRVKSGVQAEMRGAAQAGCRVG